MIYFFFLAEGAEDGLAVWQGGARHPQPGQIDLGASLVPGHCLSLFFERPVGIRLDNGLPGFPFK